MNSTRVAELLLSFRIIRKKLESVCTGLISVSAKSPRLVQRLLRPVFFFNDTATTEIYTLSLHDALPISPFVDDIEFLGQGCLRRGERTVHDMQTVVLVSGDPLPPEEQSQHNQR